MASLEEAMSEELATVVSVLMNTFPNSDLNKLTQSISNAQKLIGHADTEILIQEAASIYLDTCEYHSLYLLTLLIFDLSIWF